MKEDRKLGFIQGIIYAASMLHQYNLDADQLLRESNYSKEDFLKYADEQDIEILKDVLENF